MLKKLIFVAILGFTVACVFAQNTDKHFVCKQVSDVFGTNGGNSQSTEGRNCRTVCQPGKRGAPGPQGPPGPPGRVDDEIVAQKLNEKLQKIEVQLKCYDGVSIGNVCYRLLYRAGAIVSHDQASQLCASHGGMLPEISSESIYLTLFEYVKKTWIVDIDRRERSYVQIHLNARYMDGRVRLGNGEQSFVRWFPRYPSSTSGANSMFMEVPIKPDHPSTNQGMFNAGATHIGAPICQFFI